MNFNFFGNPICGTESPGFFIFDFSTSPPLLYYSYIPIIVISFILSLIIFLKDKKSLQSKILLLFTSFFVLWVINILVQWIASYHTVLMFAWQLTAIFELGMYIFGFYFAYVFIYKKDISFIWKMILAIIGSLILFLIPTTYNISSYDILNCEGVIGNLWDIIYMAEPAIIVSIIFIGFSKIKETNERKTKKQVLIFTAGISLFFTIFFLSNFYGEITKVYEFNLWGPLGMVIFLALLAFLIVRFKVFDIKLIGSQVLVWCLVILIGSQFFFIQTDINRILTAVTLVVTSIIGLNLIRSVKKEVAQREQLQIFSDNLKIANEKLKELDQQKSEFVSLASHQLRGPITAIKGYTSELLEGDFGEISKDVKGVIETIFKSSQALSVLIGDYLDVSRIELGKMKYDFSNFDLKALIETIVNELTPTVKIAGLTLDFVYDKKQEYIVNADQGKIKQVFSNLIDNSIKYTKKGGIEIKLERTGDMIMGRIKDTGVGINKDVLMYLFEKFSRAPDASKTNITGTGLGLYVAKKMIEEHRGRIWAESEGEGKGSTFFVELRAVKKESSMKIKVDDNLMGFAKKL